MRRERDILQERLRMIERGVEKDRKSLRGIESLEREIERDYERE